MAAEAHRINRPKGMSSDARMNQNDASEQDAIGNKVLKGQQQTQTFEDTADGTTFNRAGEWVKS